MIHAKLRWRCQLALYAGAPWTPWRSPRTWFPPFAPAAAATRMPSRLCPVWGVTAASPGCCRLSTQPAGPTRKRCEPRTDLARRDASWLNRSSCAAAFARTSSCARAPLQPCVIRGRRGRQVRETHRETHRLGGDRGEHALGMGSQESRRRIPMTWGGKLSLLLIPTEIHGNPVRPASSAPHARLEGTCQLPCACAFAPAWLPCAPPCIGAEWNAFCSLHCNGCCWARAMRNGDSRSEISSKCRVQGPWPYKAHPKQKTRKGR